MSRSDRIIADADAVLRRHSERGKSLTARSRARRNDMVMKRLGRITAAAFVIIMGAIIAGFVSPIGSNGVLIVLGLLILSTLFFSIFPLTPEVKAEKLQQADIKALPLQTERWLENQRKALPAPAVRLVDDIGVRLETLQPQLAALNPDEPAAHEVRKLLAEHLPDLVNGYARVPEPLRKQERNGQTPEGQLIEGLRLIEQEIGEMTENLAAGDLDKLAVQNRYLELKYRNPDEVIE